VAAFAPTVLYFEEGSVRFPGFIAVTWLTLLCALLPARAERRVALVIGNDRYANLADQEQLRKAVNDARAVGGALRRIGFDVISGENLGRQAMIDKIGEAAQRLAQDDTVFFFFFAGHGVAVDGANYILPADIPDVAKGQATRLKGAAIAEEYITAELIVAGARVVVVVLDACRDNPFGAGTRGLGGERGLAPREPPNGVFTLYSASRGQTALDRLSDSDGNPNSVFTRVLVPALTRPGVDLAALAIGVREEVAQIAQTAGHPQRPAYYDETVGGQVYLAGLPPANGGGGGGVSPQPPGPAADEAAWSILKDTKDVEQLRRFVAEFPGSPRRQQAEKLLKALEQMNVAVTLPLRPAETPTQEGAQAGVPQSFQWYYHFQPEGWRYWSRNGPTRWMEKYPDGTQNNFVVLRSYQINRCSGVLLQKVKGDTNDPTTQVFIPDRNCASQNLIFRFMGPSGPTSEWKLLGKMEETQY
jgi:hypothetical protein